MRMRLSAIAIVLGISAISTVCSAGAWLEPDPQADQARFAPVPLYWFTISQTPYVYRTEIDVPTDADRATVLLRTAGCVYVWVDGVQRYAWEPQPEDRRNNRPGIPSDRNRVHAVDLTDCLAPGPHAICISAPRAGFVLDGGIYNGPKRLIDLATDDKWTVTKFAPTTILENEPILKTGYKGPSGRVAAGEPWQADEDRLAAAYADALLDRAARTLDDLQWQTDLLLNKGIYIYEGAAHGWGGPARLAPAILEKARQLSAAIADARIVRARVEQAAVKTTADLRAALAVTAGLETALQDLSDEARKLSFAAVREDTDKMLRLTPDEAFGGGEMVGAERRIIEENPRDYSLNCLNVSRHDRLGWIDHPELVDSDISQWGVRVNPAGGPTKVMGPKAWLFSTDANDEGVSQLRHTIGYNIENQWPQLKPGDGWQADSRFASYKGVAWYRARLHVPAEWAPNPVKLSLRAGGLVRGWVNDREITHGAQHRGDEWTYTIEGPKITFGGENVFAFRIEADGDKRGILGPLELTCPRLESASGDGSTADVLATPLSPCIVLTPHTPRLTLQYDAASARLILPSPAGMQPAANDTYDGSAPLPANWALLWLEPKDAAGPHRPVLFVFANPPARIAANASGTQIEFAAAHQRVIAVRPWVKNVPALSDTKAIVQSVDFWCRAALAVPINYMNLTKMVRPGEDYMNISVNRIPRGPVLEQIYVYDYLETADAWGTKPLKIAPLPALCAYALEQSYRGLELAAKYQVVQDGGLLAPYKAILNTDHLTYAYPIEPFPRLTGFTSWMFSGVDAGVPGNKRELELIAWIGANTYRPQHNWSDELPPQGFFPPGEKRTRVEITADYSNAVGVNYMNNIDQVLGSHHQMVKDDYDNFMPLVCDHYEKIARQLHDRPFWAVAYDLINEPFDHKAAKYNPAMRELTRRVRAIDDRHLCYVEPCQAWGAIQNLPLVEPTGDPLTVYSFHDYNFRLFKPADRWPTLERDIRNINRMWLPAYKYLIDHGVCMHCGEFGGFDHATDEQLAQTTLMNDFFRIFDQFGMHSNYYSGRELFKRQADGSLKPSNVVNFYRNYFRTNNADRYHELWQGHPTVQ